MMMMSIERLEGEEGGEGEEEELDCGERQIVASKMKLAGSAGGNYAPLKFRCKHRGRMRHKTSDNRLQQATARRGSQLVLSFGEFLASRNVINQRYEKLASRHRRRSRSGELAHNEQLQGEPDCSWQLCEGRPMFSVAKCNQMLASKGELEPGKRGPVKQLLAALFRRNQKNKRHLLLSLIRAPIVLAALFSFLLVLSLIVLYTMSFTSHNYHRQLNLMVSSQELGNQLHPHALLSPQAEPLEHVNNRRHLREPQRFLLGGLERPTSIGGEDDESDNQELEAELRIKQLTGGAGAGAGAGERWEGEQPGGALSTNHQAAGEISKLARKSKIEETTNTLDAALTVQTECGAFVGQLEANAIVFRGIPYASPPINERRWKRPKPVWLEPKLCRPNSRFGSTLRPHCAQLGPIARRFTGHEDCLYLDVYAPQLNQVKKLPVMVYIHGGFLAYGSSGLGQVNWMKARPSAKLASELNVVLVAFNYRLQALGFLTLVQLAQNNGPDGSEGNYGLWDQLAALNWVRRNIESFGGNPDNIVLFGPDSASALPLAMLTAPTNSFSPAESEHESGGDAANKLTYPGKRPADEEVKVEVEVKVKVKVKVGTSLDSSNSSLGQFQSGRRGDHLDELISPSKDLFRAVWLTNPTVFYELPYEQASKHYQRLFLNQLPCFNSSQLNKQQSGESKMLACLMSLSAEQVARQYLGGDDPSYRLDDQNSLPIHGILADQFVTIDRELVHRSYPYQSSSYPTPTTTTKTTTATTSLSPSLSSTATATAAAAAAAEATTATTSTSTRGESNENTEGNYGQAEGDNCAGPICAPNQLAAFGKDLLLGSSAQAVEYWPCPRNLHQWTWPEFQRYVGTSLNSFTPTTYKRASELYQINANLSGANLSATSQPAPVYLSMVSDIKQICPSNQLASSLGSIGHRVRRYIVENGAPAPTQPNGPRSSSSQDRGGSIEQIAANDSNSSREPGELKHAFHMWDLIAFFGFEFEPNFEPTQDDLKFQLEIRRMVKSFVHQSNDWPASRSMPKMKPIAVVDRRGGTKLVDRYKVEECEMWAQHLGNSYAWIS